MWSASHISLVAPFLVACIKIVFCSESETDLVTIDMEPTLFFITRVVIDDTSYFFCSTCSQEVPEKNVVILCTGNKSLREQKE